jgi:hypothetical protein
LREDDNPQPAILVVSTSAMTHFWTSDLLRLFQRHRGAFWPLMV